LPQLASWKEREVVVGQVNQHGPVEPPIAGLAAGLGGKQASVAGGGVQGFRRILGYVFGTERV